MLHRLSDLGALDFTHFKRGVLTPKAPRIRLHGLMYQLLIIHSNKTYEKIRSSCNIQDFGDFKLNLFKKSITLWIMKDFLGCSSESAKRLSLDYLNNTLSFIERKYQISIRKKGYQTIKEVKSHYARIRDGLAEKAVGKKEFITFKNPKDDKEWLRIDSSETPELETTHPQEAFHNMKDIIEPFYAKLHQDPKFLDSLELSLSHLSDSLRKLILEETKTRVLMVKLLEAFIIRKSTNEKLDNIFSLLKKSINKNK